MTTDHESTAAATHSVPALAPSPPHHVAPSASLAERAAAVRELAVAVEVACPVHLHAGPGTPCLPPSADYRLGLTCAPRLDAALDERAAAELAADERQRERKGRELSRRRQTAGRELRAAFARTEFVRRSRLAKTIHAAAVASSAVAFDEPPTDPANAPAHTASAEWRSNGDDPRSAPLRGTRAAPAEPLTETITDQPGSGRNLTDRSTP